MKIKNSTKTEAILSEIGKRLTRQRIEAKLTQAGLAEKAQVSKRTIERLEAGSSIQLATMLQVLRVFKMLEPFGLALAEKQSRLPGKKRPQKTATTEETKTEPSKKSHSWGY